MKVNEYQRSRLVFEFGQRSLRFQMFSFSETVGSFENQISCEMLWEDVNEN